MSSLVAMQNTSPSRTRRVRFIAMTFLLFFIGLRGHVYTDCVEYYYLFEEIPKIGSLHVDDFNMEPGFIIYTSLFKTIIPNYFCWVFFNSLVDLVVLYLFLKNNTKYLVLGLLIFLAYQGLYIEFNLYRNAKALTLFLISLPYLKERRLLPYLLLNIVGATIHVGALLFVPLYFFVHKKWGQPLLWGLVIIANICFFAEIHITSALLDRIAVGSSEYLAFKANKYAGISESVGLSFGYIEKTLVICLIILLYKKLIAGKPSNIIFCNCAVIFYFVTYFFSDISILTERLSYQFIFAMWVILAEVFCIRFKYKKIVTLGIIVLLLLRLMVSNMTAMCYYDNVLWGIMSIDQRASIISMFN